MKTRIATVTAVALCLAGAGFAAVAQDTPATPVNPGTAASPSAPNPVPSAADPNAATTPPTDPAAAPAPPAPPSIEEVFRLRCRSCHAESNTGNGPSLKGVYNRKLAAVKEYADNYSPAIKAKGGKWDDKMLDAYIESPRAAIPGTKMITRTPVPEQRAALIEYLKTYK